MSSYNYKILIAHHSLSNNDAFIIKSYFERPGENFKVILIEEKSAFLETLSNLSNLVLNCDAFVLLPSIEFQKNQHLMEIVYYGKDVSANIYSLNFFSNYKPFGALGAISMSSKKGIIQIVKDSNFKTSMDDLIQVIKQNINPNKKIEHFSIRPLTAVVDFEYSTSQTNCSVLISCHKNQLEIAGLVKKGIESDETICVIEDTSSSTKTILKQVNVLLVIMSIDYEENLTCRGLVEMSRLLDKSLVPVVTAKGYKAVNWLALVIGGKLWYRIIDQQQAYKKKYDSTPMNDLKQEVLRDLNPKDMNAKSHREIELMIALQNEMDNLKLKQNFKDWPPEPSEIRNQTPNGNHIEPIETVKEEKASEKQREFKLKNYGKNSTIKENFKEPKQLFDQNGRPLRESFDCMISYNWAKQDLVHNMYMYFHELNYSIWFDIEGGMQGNCYDSMSTAVECSKVILVFLNDKYLASANCKLEFKYSCYRGKPFVFIITEFNLKMEEHYSWLQPHLSNSPVYEIYNDEMCGELVNGVTKIDLIANSIRQIADAQSLDKNDCSCELNSEIRALKDSIDKTKEELVRQ